MKMYDGKDRIQDRHKWKKKSLRSSKHSMTEVVEPEEEEEEEEEEWYRVGRWDIKRDCHSIRLCKLYSGMTKCKLR